MTVRFYILPIETNSTGDGRGPKYFKWGLPGWDPDPQNAIDCPWSMKDYGSINNAILCADISATDHTNLASNSDVLVIPTNIDNTLTVSARNVARNFLENYNIPAGWIATGTTYRSVLRTITEFFLFFQRITVILGHDINLPVGWMDLTIAQISGEIRSAMMQYADENNIDYSLVTQTTTMRSVMKYIADGWGTTPILFGLAVL